MSTIAERRLFDHRLFLAVAVAFPVLVLIGFGSHGTTQRACSRRHLFRRCWFMCTDC